jgi:hypothetical protein
MAIDKKAAQQLLRDINAILNREWDPLGLQGCPNDEYES